MKLFERLATHLPNAISNFGEIATPTQKNIDNRPTLSKKDLKLVKQYEKNFKALGCHELAAELRAFAGFNLPYDKLAGYSVQNAMTPNPTYPFRYQLFEVNAAQEEYLEKNCPEVLSKS